MRLQDLRHLVGIPACLPLVSRWPTHTSFQSLLRYPPLLRCPAYFHLQRNLFPSLPLPRQLLNSSHSLLPPDYERRRPAAQQPRPHCCTRLPLHQIHRHRYSLLLQLRILLRPYKIHGIATSTRCIQFSAPLRTWISMVPLVLKHPSSKSISINFWQFSK